MISNISLVAEKILSRRTMQRTEARCISRITIKCFSVRIGVGNCFLRVTWKHGIVSTRLRLITAAIIAQYSLLTDSIFNPPPPSAPKEVKSFVCTLSPSLAGRYHEGRYPRCDLLDKTTMPSERSIVRWKTDTIDRPLYMRWPIWGGFRKNLRLPVNGNRHALSLSLLQSLLILSSSRSDPEQRQYSVCWAFDYFDSKSNGSNLMERRLSTWIQEKSCLKSALIWIRVNQETYFFTAKHVKEKIIDIGTFWYIGAIAISHPQILIILTNRKRVTADSISVMVCRVAIVR